MPAHSSTPSSEPQPPRGIPRHSIFLGALTTGGLCVWTNYNRIVIHLAARTQPDFQKLTVWLADMCEVFVMALLRARLPRWPLHPVGIAAGHSGISAQRLSRLTDQATHPGVRRYPIVIHGSPVLSGPAHRLSRKHRQLRHCIQHLVPRPRPLVTSVVKRHVEGGSKKSCVILFLPENIVENCSRL